MASQPEYNVGKLLAPDISDMIHEDQTEELREVLLTLLPPELADVVLALTIEDRTLVLELLPDDRAAEVFAFLTPDQQREVIPLISQETLAGLLNEMASDDRTALFEEASPHLVSKMMAVLKPDERREAKQLLNFPAESIGRLISTDFLTVRPNWTCQRVLEHVRRHGDEAETLSTLYVLDNQGRLIDDVSLRAVLMSDPSTTVAELIDGQIVSLKATEDREQAVGVMERYDLPVLPVVDDEGVMLGVVTFDDVADVARQEATEDFHKAVAVAPLPASYTATSIWSLYQRRVGWLVFLVFVHLISSGVISAYEDMLTQVVALAFFVPLLIGSGGNTGSQAATLMVRALATRDIALNQWMLAVTKELGVGLALGATMALAAGVMGRFWGGNWEVALIVGVAMFGIVIVSNLIGVLLPLVLTRIGIDPAVASSPLIATLADATGLLLYFNVAVLVLGRLQVAT